jgi:hypothetical protein
MLKSNVVQHSKRDIDIVYKPGLYLNDVSDELMAQI